MRIGFVCTNYNNSQFTREAVRTLLAAGGDRVEIVVVDNSSEPADVTSLRLLKSDYSNIDLILSPENIGYFRGLNLGIRHLRTKYPGVDCLIVGNNDLEFPTDFVSRLRAIRDLIAEHPVISPDVVTVDGVHQNPHVISAISKPRAIAYDIYHSNYYIAVAMLRIAKLTRRFTGRRDGLQWQKSRKIYQGHGSCYILGPVFFAHFAELWAPSFMMGEEFFLAKQLADHGLGVYYEPSVRVIHHYHASVSKVPAKRMWSLARDAHKVYRRYVKIFY